MHPFWTCADRETALCEVKAGNQLSLPDLGDPTGGKVLNWAGNRKLGNTGYFLAYQIRNPKKIPKLDQAGSKNQTLSIRH